MTLVLGATTLVSPAWAENAPFKVSSGADDGPGSLRAALEAANTQEGPDIIEIDAGLTVSVLSTLMSSDELTVTVQGDGRATLSADGDGWGASNEMFDVDGGITLRNLDFSGNGAASVGLDANWGAFMPTFLVQNTKFDNFVGPAVKARKLSWDSGMDQTIILDAITVTGSGDPAESGDGYLSFYVDSSITIRNSTFTDNRGSYPSVRSENMTAEMQILVENNYFSGNSEIAEGCFSASADVTGDRSEGGDTPALVFRNNVVEDCAAPVQEYGLTAPVRLAFGAEGDEKSSGSIGVLAEGNTITRSAGDDNAGILFYSGVDPEFELNALFRNNTIVAEALNGTPAISLLVSSAESFRLSHNTIVGGGIETVLTTGWPHTDAPTTLGLDNNIVDSGNFPAFVTSWDDTPLYELEVSASHNAMTNPGEELLSNAGITLSTEQMRLGPLAVNENPFAPLSMMPNVDSPLIDAGVETSFASDLDQRGQARFVGLAPDIGSVEVALPELDPVMVELGEDVRVIEGEDAIFYVSRSGPKDQPGSVVLSASDGSAVAGTDYGEASGFRLEVSWLAGETKPIEVRVPTLNRDGDQGDRDFLLTLVEAGDGTELGERISARGTISDFETVDGGEGDADADADGGVDVGVDADTDDSSDSDSSSGGDGNESKTPPVIAKPLAETGASSNFVGMWGIGLVLLLGGVGSCLVNYSSRKKSASSGH